MTEPTDIAAAHARLERDVAAGHVRLAALRQEYDAVNFDAEFGDAAAASRRPKLQMKLAALEAQLAAQRRSLAIATERLEARRRAERRAECEADWQRARALLAERAALAESVDGDIGRLGRNMRRLAALGAAAHDAVLRHVGVALNLSIAPTMLDAWLLTNVGKAAGIDSEKLPRECLGDWHETTALAVLAADDARRLMAHAPVPAETAAD